MRRPRFQPLALGIAMAGLLLAVSACKAASGIARAAKGPYDVEIGADPGNVEFVCVIIAPQDNLKELESQVEAARPQFLTIKSQESYHDFLQIYPGPDDEQGWSVEPSDVTLPTSFLKSYAVSKDKTVELSIERDFDKEATGRFAVVVKYENGTYHQLNYPSSEMTSVDHGTIAIGTTKLLFQKSD